MTPHSKMENKMCCGFTSSIKTCTKYNNNNINNNYYYSLTSPSIILLNAHTYPYQCFDAIYAQHAQCIVHPCNTGTLTATCMCAHVICTMFVTKHCYASGICSEKVQDFSESHLFPPKLWEKGY